MARINTRLIIPAVSLVVGVAWAVIGVVQFGWWFEGRPASGFFPSLVGIVLAAVAVIALTGEARGEVPQFFRYHLYPLAAAVAVVLAALLIGFFPAMTIYVLLWTKLYERYSWRFSILLTIFAIGGVYAIFRLWLRIPFPAGALVRLITG